MKCPWNWQEIVCQSWRNENKRQPTQCDYDRWLQEGNRQMVPSRSVLTQDPRQLPRRINILSKTSITQRTVLYRNVLKIELLYWFVIWPYNCYFYDFFVLYWNGHQSYLFIFKLVIAAQNFFQQIDRFFILIFLRKSTATVILKVKCSTEIQVFKFSSHTFTVFLTFSSRAVSTCPWNMTSWKKFEKRKKLTRRLDVEISKTAKLLENLNYCFCRCKCWKIGRCGWC